jgi:carboxypeptidase T
MKKIFFLLTALMLVSTIVSASGDRSFVEVKISDLKEISHFQNLGLDVAGVNRKDKLVGIVADQSEIGLLKSEGYDVLVRVASSRPEDASLDQYYTPEEMLDIINQAAASYPGIAKVIKISDELFEGHFVYAVKITKNVDEENNRPSFILDAQHHAREVMTSQIAVDMVQYLTSKYGADPEVTNWVDNINIIIIPMVNPDGISYVFTNDRWWRKNRNPACGVDLNRNYDFNWGACDGSSDWCQDETYRGASAGSEPETQAMSAVMADNPAIFALTYHSYGEYILYPMGCGDASEDAALGEAGFELNSILENDQGYTGMYLTGPSWSTIYITDGSSDELHYGRYGVFSYCIEVNGTGFQPDFTQWRNVTVERQRTAWKFFLDKTLSAPMIQGFVTDASTGVPIPAQVDIEEIPLIHNEDPRHASQKGFYARVVPKNATYHVTFSRTGYCSQTKEVAVGEGVAALNVNLSASGLTPPSSPIPANGAVNQQLSTTISWQGTAGSYSIYFGESQTPQFLATTSSNSYALPNLEYGKTYYWRVDTNGACGSSAGQTWSFSTYKYGITSAAALKNPLRLVITGEGFTFESFIKINGAAVPSSSHKSSTKLVGKGGNALKAMLPKGTQVSITVEDSSGGTSVAFPFTR